jgi:hypothetical protein
VNSTSAGDSWAQTTVEATEQYDLENELQSVARHAKKDDVAGVNRDVGDLHQEQVGVDLCEEDIEDNDDALLQLDRHLYL